ncbi:hypothetical protein B566_EDAN002925 [Ephemera danica]|nr:hypothetical protein B566_EDAN002925 [Ephemera danica]
MGAAMEDIEQRDQDSADEEVTEKTPAKRTSRPIRNSNISSEGEGSQRRSTVSAVSSPRGLSLSKSLRRRYVLALCLILGGIMLAIVILGIVGAMSSGDDTSESTTPSALEYTGTDFTPTFIPSSEPPDQHQEQFTESTPHQTASEHHADEMLTQSTVAE